MGKIKRKFSLNNSKVTFGALLIYFGIGVLFILMIAQFTKLMIFQTIDDEDLVARGQDKYAVSAINTPERGEIIDREGNILASDMEAYRIAIITDDNYPNHVSNPKETAAHLAEIVDMSKEDIQTRIDEGIEKGQFQVELGQQGRNISYNDRKYIEESDATGIVFEPEKRRF